MSLQVIRIHAAAPPKPAPGASCNGCGVCCAAEPCPPARWALFQWKGSCRALVWEESRYVCGLVLRPDAYLPWLPWRWRDAAGRFFARRIAAGAGCDSDAGVEAG